MRTIASVGVAALLLAACNSESSAPVDTSAQSTETEAAMAEPAMGDWRPLFNGQDLTGWRGYKKDAPGENWVVEDGVLTLTAGGAGDIMTEEQFGPFELSLEWKISEGGNSGVIYLIREDDAAPNTYNTGPELQVLDDDRHGDGQFPSHRAGALYDIEVPPEGATKPVGEWNEAVILFTGSRIEHWLNGVLVSESSYGDDAWREKVAASKFVSMPLFGTFSSGHIALQDHGDRVWYRNIQIRTP